jgi:lysyl-tRNA synthetase class 2
LALDENIYEIRLEKLKKIAALGHPAYLRKFNYSHTMPQILAEYSGQTTEELESPRVTVRVAGRIMAIRLMGNRLQVSSEDENLFASHHLDHS